jgi:DNA (cytosine-5)-methyltransferase 1
VYYNEIDPFAAQWLRNLIAAGHLPDGDVDERSIVSVRPDDVRAYDQCHWFAGIGGWSLALRLAGWPDARPVWTGSAPCQPFSGAGQGKAAHDERHLWPAWASLIRECRPPTILGEQVEAAIGWGWLDLVFSDLEAAGYACASAILPACSVGAPHIRQRVWFVAQSVADDDEGGREVEPPSWLHDRRESGDDIDRCGKPGGWVADADCGDLESGGMERRSALVATEPRGEEHRGAGIMGNASAPGLSACQCEEPPGAPQHAQGRAIEQSGSSPWSDLVWLRCTDGKARPTKPGIQPLAHGVSARVGKLRAAGNAIVAPLAAEFIKAVMECMDRDDC